jgi:hypothetical protein
MLPAHAAAALEEPHHLENPTLVPLPYSPRRSCEDLRRSREVLPSMERLAPTRGRRVEEGGGRSLKVEAHRGLLHVADAVSR